MDTPGRQNFWHQNDVNQTNKNNVKLPISSQVNNQYREAIQFYEPNNGLKRSYAGSTLQNSPPLKKRQYPPPTTSSADHSDDDDDDDDDEAETNNSHSTNSNNEKTSNPKRDENKRRAAHTAAEQKRRNAIRKGYDALQGLVPNSHLLDPISSQKVSKAAILKRSIDYLMQLNNEKEQLKDQLEAKKKETFCLRAVQKTYEDILEMNTNARKNANVSIDDEHKFQVFQTIADTIFHSFDQAMQSGQVIDFNQFTSTILRWVEDSCRPSDVNEIIRRVVENFKS